MNLDINHKKETDWLLQIQVDNKMGPCPPKGPDDSKTKLQDQSSVSLLLSQAVLAR
jgi:hypothetical protein